MESLFNKSEPFEDSENKYTADFEHTSGVKVYTFSKAKLVLSIFTVWIISFAISAFLVMIFATVFLTSGIITPSSYLAAIAVPGLVISLIFTAIYSLFSLNKRIEIDRNGIAFYRTRKKYSYYPINMQISSYVEWTLGGDFLTDSSRVLRFNLPNGKRKEESFKCFSKDTFAAVVSDINNIRLYGKIDNKNNAFYAGASSQNSLQAKFTIPKQQMRDAEKQHQITPLGIAVMTIACAVTIPLFLNFLDILPKEYILGFMLFGVIFLPLLFILSAKELNKNIEICPECIELYTDRIQIDNAYFLINTIQKITMTPTTYKETKNGMSQFRYLTIYTQTEKKEYSLGKTSGKDPNMVFSDYKMLFESVHAWCFDHNVMFFDELG